MFFFYIFSPPLIKHRFRRVQARFFSMNISYMSTNQFIKNQSLNFENIRPLFDQTYRLLVDSFEMTIDNQLFILTSYMKVEKDLC
jgi:hypothetical protein